MTGAGVRIGGCVGMLVCCGARRNSLPAKKTLARTIKLHKNTQPERNARLLKYVVYKKECEGVVCSICTNEMLAHIGRETVGKPLLFIRRIWEVACERFALR